MLLQALGTMEDALLQGVDLSGLKDFVPLDVDSNPSTVSGSDNFDASQEMASTMSQTPDCSHAGTAANLTTLEVRIQNNPTAFLVFSSPCCAHLINQSVKFCYFVTSLKFKLVSQNFIIARNKTLLTHNKQLANCQ